MVPCTELSGRAQAGYCDGGIERVAALGEWSGSGFLRRTKLPGLKHKREIDEEGAGRRMSPSERPVGPKYRVRGWGMR